MKLSYLQHYPWSWNFYEHATYFSYFYGCLNPYYDAYKIQETCRHLYLLSHTIYNILINSYTLMNSVQAKQCRILMHIIFCFCTLLIPSRIVFTLAKFWTKFSDVSTKELYSWYVKMNEDVAKYKLKKKDLKTKITI